MTEKHGHVHHSKSTQNIINAEELLKNADIKLGDVFLDAGCGDDTYQLKHLK